MVYYYALVKLENQHSDDSPIFVFARNPMILDLFASQFDYKEIISGQYESNSDEEFFEYISQNYKLKLKPTCDDELFVIVDKNSGDPHALTVSEYNDYNFDRTLELTTSIMYHCARSLVNFSKFFKDDIGFNDDSLKKFVKILLFYTILMEDLNEVESLIELEYMRSFYETLMGDDLDLENFYKQDHFTIFDLVDFPQLWYVCEIGNIAFIF